MRATSAARSRGCPAGARRARRCWWASPLSESSRRASGAAEWSHCPTPPGIRCARSCSTTSGRAPRVITDGWKSYPPATRDLYVHEPLEGASGADASNLLPGVHTVASLAKRWLLGTHQGRLDDAHLASYLNEFVFRFDRRRSLSRGLVFYRVLELAAAHEPIRYRDLILNPGRRTARPPLPPTSRGKPASLDRPPANRPWRAATPLYSG